MKRYIYILLVLLAIGLFFSLSTLNKIEQPLIDRSQLPRCSNEVVISSDLKSDIISYSDSRIKRGTGESYFNNHFLFKNIDYSALDCLFTVRYEFVYDRLHTDMSIVLKVFDEETFEIMGTDSFLRPVGLLVSPNMAEDIVSENQIEYDYYNIVISVEKQTFFYEFYKKTLTEGDVLVVTIDAQSKELRNVKKPTEFVPLV